MPVYGRLVGHSRSLGAERSAMSRSSCRRCETFDSSTPEGSERVLSLRTAPGGGGELIYVQPHARPCYTKPRTQPSTVTSTRASTSRTAASARPRPNPLPTRQPAQPRLQSHQLRDRLVPRRPDRAHQRGHQTSCRQSKPSPPASASTTPTSPPTWRTSPDSQTAYARGKPRRARKRRPLHRRDPERAAGREPQPGSHYCHWRPIPRLFPPQHPHRLALHHCPRGHAPGRLMSRGLLAVRGWRAWGAGSDASCSALSVCVPAG